MPFEVVFFFGKRDFGILKLYDQAGLSGTYPTSSQRNKMLFLLNARSNPRFEILVRD